MKRDSVIVTIAVVAVLASFVGLLMNYGALSEFNNLFTGFVSSENSTGVVNVTIASTTSVIIFSANGTVGGKSLEWGTGSIETLNEAVYLITNGTNINSDGWAVIDEGFIIQNNGNVNVNLTVDSTYNAADFIGGNANGGPLFQFNITNNETGSCSDNATVFGVYDGNDFLVSEVALCNNFTTPITSDSLRMDVLLKIPSNAVGFKTTNVVLNYESIE